MPCYTDSDNDVNLTSVLQKTSQVKVSVLQF